MFSLFRTRLEFEGDHATSFEIIPATHIFYDHRSSQDVTIMLVDHYVPERSTCARCEGFVKLRRSAAGAKQLVCVAL